VKNAIATYDLFPRLDAFDVNDLLKAHDTMMQALTNEAGRFRRGGVGVFGETGCVHIAPPADRVPYLINDHFGWLRSANDHLLIRSCVFHYEFEFIHPFIDGNGRMGRLWQSLILTKLHPLFQHLPVENMVYAILSIIAHTPQASAREMAEVLGITPRQCERILASLKQKGLIARVGAAKGGHWKIRL
jgi:Fic family protein